jgi:CheY-like chemotaxis protein
MSPKPMSPKPMSPKPSSPLPPPTDAQAMLLLVWRPGPRRTAALRLLQDLGFTDVRCADTAVAAFPLLAAARPRLVLVESELRPTPGLVFVRELRATTVSVRDAPAVIVAPKPTEGFADRARAAGADGVIFGAPNAAAIQFWLACTGPNVRHVVEGRDYRGPDRREAGRAFVTVEHDRRKAPVCASVLAAVDADPVMTRLTEAQKAVRAWSETGAESALAQALEAVSAAVDVAKAARQALLAETLLAAKQRMDEDARTWDADPLAIAGVLSLVRDFAFRRLSAGHSGARGMTS